MSESFFQQFCWGVLWPETDCCGSPLSRAHSASLRFRVSGSRQTETGSRGRKAESLLRLEGLKGESQERESLKRESLKRESLKRESLKRESRERERVERARDESQARVSSERVERERVERESREREREREMSLKRAEERERNTHTEPKRTNTLLKQRVAGPGAPKEHYISQCSVRFESWLEQCHADESTEPNRAVQQAITRDSKSACCNAWKRQLTSAYSARVRCVKTKHSKAKVEGEVGRQSAQSRGFCSAQATLRRTFSFL